MFTIRLSSARLARTHWMAYYSGNYYQTNHIADYYSQSLFSATTPWPHDLDSYTDSYQDHDHDNEVSRPRRRPYTIRDSPTDPPSSSPPRSSPPPQHPNDRPKQSDTSTAPPQTEP